MARVRVRLFAKLREELGEKEIELEARTVGDVVKALKISHANKILVAINNRLIDVSDAKLKAELKEGDVVDLMPPFSGG